MVFETEDGKFLCDICSEAYRARFDAQLCEGLGRASDYQIEPGEIYKKTLLNSSEDNLRAVLFLKPTDNKDGHLIFWNTYSSSLEGPHKFIYSMGDFIIPAEYSELEDGEFKRVKKVLLKRNLKFLDGLEFKKGNMEHFNPEGPKFRRLIDEAVSVEDYESAARFRDILKSRRLFQPSLFWDN